MPISNAQLAADISDLTDKWRTREAEFNAWLTGAADGGEQSDGKYPLTDYLGTTRYTKSPARLEADVSGLVDSAASYSAAAQAYADDSAASAASALEQAGLSEASRVAADVSKSVAIEKASDAANSAANALASAQNAEAEKVLAASAKSAAEAAQGYAEIARDAALGYRDDAADSAQDAADAAAAAQTWNPTNYARLTDINTFVAEYMEIKQPTAGSAAYLAFRTSDGGTAGYIGDGSGSNDNITLYAAPGNSLNLYSDGTLRLSIPLSGPSKLDGNLHVFGGSIYGTRYSDAAEMIRGSDQWMRLNPNGEFDSGVYTPGIIRADQGFQVAAAKGLNNDVLNYGSFKVYGAKASYVGIQLDTPNNTTFMEHTSTGALGIYCQSGSRGWIFRDTGNEFVVGNRILASNNQPYLRFASGASIAGGEVHISSGPPSGTPVTGEIWIQYI